MSRVLLSLVLCLNIHLKQTNLLSQLRRERVAKIKVKAKSKWLIHGADVNSLSPIRQLQK